MGKGNANIKIGADVHDAKNGIDKITKELNKLTKSAKESSFSKLSKSIAAFGSAFNFAIGAIKKVNAAIKETGELYRIQIKAETQLETAAKNNPYLNSSSVKQLKEFASHLQSISTVGDEELLPMMAQLASAGRTQEEIQKIMSAALDVSASGVMSLDTAVTQLNKTYSGTTGTLGNQIKELKNLTKEELESGKAIDIVAEKFKGIAEETTKASGSVEQLKNSWGDVKEELGGIFDEPAKKMRSFLTEAFSGISSLLSNLRKARTEAEAGLESLKRVQADYENGTATASIEDYEILETTAEEHIEKHLNKIDELSKKYDQLSEKQKKSKKGLEIQKQIEEENKSVDSLMVAIDEFNTKIQKKQIAAFNDLIKQAEEAESIEAKKAIETQAKAYETILNDKRAFKEGILKIENDITQTELNNAMQIAVKAQQDYEQKIQNYNDEIKKRKELGEVISDEDRILGEIKIRQEGLFDLVNEFEMIDWEDKDIKAYIEDLRVLREELKNVQDVQDNSKNKKLEGMDKAESTEKSAKNFLGIVDLHAMSNQITETITALESYRDRVAETLGESSEEWQTYTDKIKELSDLREQVINQENEVIKQENEEALQASLESTKQLMDNIATYVDRFSEITNGVTSLIRDQNKQETDEELAALSEQYTDGAISYEEYCEKKKEIDKKAAQEEYKLKMWEWNASFLQATANIAQGVAAALTQVPPASYIMAALTAASGAIQIATIMANKPRPPSFASGGIVPGRSYSGDRVSANVNSGEMILNGAQQARLWQIANGNGGGGNTVLNVDIHNNSQSKVSTQLDKNGLRVIVDDLVNGSMQQGRYQKSMEISQSKAEGKKYL